MATTSRGYPYPVSTDTPDVPRDIKALADVLNVVVGIVVSGLVSTPAPGAVPGTSGPVTVTFPAGKFVTAPRVVATAEGSGGTVSFAMVANVTATAFDIYRYQVSGAAAVRSVHWNARLD